MNLVRRIPIGYLFGGTGFVLSKKNKMDLPVVPLHKFPEHKMDCCRLINDEWKRSETARLRSLECSGDSLPTCLILLDEHNKVIGHCKLSAIPSIPDGCFVESVVIERELRGKGYGSYLMSKTEEYCQEFLRLKVIYLSTRGQEVFYSKLGYSECEPISIFGSFVLTNRPNLRTVSVNLNGYVNKKSVNSKTYMCKNIS